MLPDDIVHLPPNLLPAKPKEGEKCNGCGFCCHMQVCPIGMVVYETSQAPCPGMVFEDGRVKCAVVLGEALYKEYGGKAPDISVSDILGINTGCDSKDIFDGITR